MYVEENLFLFRQFADDIYSPTLSRTALILRSLQTAVYFSTASLSYKSDDCSGVYDRNSDNRTRIALHAPTSRDWVSGFTYPWGSTYNFSTFDIILLLLYHEKFDLNVAP